MLLYYQTAKSHNPSVAMVTAGQDNGALFLMMKGWKEEKE